MSRNAEIERSFEGGHAWFAVWVHAGHERRVFRKLHDLGFAPYLPGGEELLFTGYVFVLAAACRDTWGKIRPKDHIGERCGPIVVGSVEMGYILVVDGDEGDDERDTGIEGVGGLLCDDGHPVVIPHMQLANPFYADILAFIKSVSPSDPIFRSNKAKRREAAWNRRLAIAKAS